MQALLDRGVSTLVFKTGKTSTTLNLTPPKEGQKSGTKDPAPPRQQRPPHRGLRSRRDLIVGR